MGQVSQKADDIDGAIQEFRTVIKLKPDFIQAYNDLGLALSPEARPQGAVAAFNLALELDSNNLTAHHNLGMALIQKSEYAAAIVQYRKLTRARAERRRSALQSRARVKASKRFFRRSRERIA